MNIKEMLYTAVAVLVALIAYDLVIKKFVIKSDFEESFEE
jgi:hypothetical protein